MGMIRKTLSVSTFGLIDFRSDKERTARYARQTRNAARKVARHGANGATPARGSGVAPGWYPDPTGTARLRYWDGARWTDDTAA